MTQPQRRHRNFLAALMMALVTVLGLASVGPGATTAAAAVSGPRPGNTNPDPYAAAWAGTTANARTAVLFWGAHGFPQETRGTWYTRSFWQTRPNLYLNYQDVYTGGRYQDRDNQLRNWLTGNGVGRYTVADKFGFPVWTNLRANQWLGTFTEYDVTFYTRPQNSTGRPANPAARSGGRNALRIVRDNLYGHTFYTDDHYRNFHYIGRWDQGPNGLQGP